jgi:excisionase family DNA binding protein
MSNSTHATRSGTTLYSIATVAERLEISQDTVRRLIARGDLKVMRIGSAVPVDAAELEAFLDRQRTRERQIVSAVTRASKSSTSESSWR